MHKRPSELDLDAHYAYVTQYIERGPHDGAWTAHCTLCGRLTAPPREARADAELDALGHGELISSGAAKLVMGGRLARIIGPGGSARCAPPAMTEEEEDREAMQVVLPVDVAAAAMCLDEDDFRRDVLPNVTCTAGGYVPVAELARWLQARAESADDAE